MLFRPRRRSLLLMLRSLIIVILVQRRHIDDLSPIESVPGHTNLLRQPHRQPRHDFDRHRLSVVLAEQVTLLETIQHVDNMRIVGPDDVIVNDEDVVVLDNGLILASKAIVDFLRHRDDRLGAAAQSVLIVVLVLAGVVNARQRHGPVVVALKRDELVIRPRALRRSAIFANGNNVGLSRRQPRERRKTIRFNGRSRGDRRFNDAIGLFTDFTSTIRDGASNWASKQSGHGIEDGSKVDIGRLSTKDIANSVCESSNDGANNAR